MIGRPFSQQEALLPPSSTVELLLRMPLVATEEPSEEPDVTRRVPALAVVAVVDTSEGGCRGGGCR